MSTVNTEIGAGRVWNTRISLGDTDVRNLAKRPSGSVSMGDLRGKSSYTPMSGYADGGWIYDNNDPWGTQTYTVTPTAYVQGGQGTLRYLWQWQDGGPPLTLSQTDMYYCRVSLTTKYASSGSGTLRVRVTDDTGREFWIYNIPVEIVVGQPL